MTPSSRRASYDSRKIVTSQKGDTGFASDGADPAMREASRFALRTVKHEKGEPMGFPRELKRTAAGAAGCSCPFNPQGKKQLGGRGSQKTIKSGRAADRVLSTDITSKAHACRWKL